MPKFRALNDIKLFAAGDFRTTVKNKKLKELPENFDELPWFHERTDRREPTDHLVTQDRVILIIQRVGYVDIYELVCTNGVGSGRR